MLAVEMRGVHKRYRASGDALRDLDLEVREGEAVALLGPNGAGKTTAISCLVDLVGPTRGTVALFGRPAAEPAIRARVGYLPQSVGFPDHYRADTLLAFHAALLGIPPAARAARVAEVLARVDLQSAARERLARYSPGMLQRLAFAQALLGDPDLLVLDEPTASLDPLARRRFSDILRDEKRRGKTILVSSHILSEVETICDRVAILKAGVLVRSGRLVELCLTGAVKLHVARLASPSIESLVSAGAEVALDAGGATVRCADDAVRRSADDILARHSIAIERVEPERSSLEEVFVAAVTGSTAA